MKRTLLTVLTVTALLGTGTAVVAEWNTANPKAADVAAWEAWEAANPEWTTPGAYGF